MAWPNAAYGYGGQPIASGELAAFSVASNGLPSDLALPGGEVVPARLLAPEEVDSAMGITAEDLAAAEPAGGAAGGWLEDLLPGVRPTCPRCLGYCACVSGVGRSGPG